MNRSSNVRSTAPRPVGALHRSRARRRGLGISAVNLAIGFAIGGSLLAVAIPAFVRELHASRFAEPIDGLQRIGAAAIAYAKDRPASEAFPPSVALTPSAPPRGTREIDPPGTWDDPTWQALEFRPVAKDGVPHAFAFAFDSARSPGRSTFTAHAHGDLDGDGARSTFEIRGIDDADDPRGATLEPGMYIESEIE